jgi:hypothetical protein
MHVILLSLRLHWAVIGVAHIDHERLLADCRWIMRCVTFVLSVFYHSTSEFIRMLRCSRKTVVASKDTKNYTGSGRGALRLVSKKDQVRVPRLNALKFLQ